ncbi:MAG: NIPSNAP family containing protein [bacterium]|nr:NIPSNAP family containing protein [Deltaproteobacteria bacterium]MCP4904491.1 NIPSNAP family containing protein [bacterium]
MNDKVYIHEFIDIRGQGRAKYMQHMTANWSPIGQEERSQKCFGTFGTVGSTGRWPETINIWEEDGWRGLARNFAFETQHPGMQDPSLREWWSAAAEFRRGGFDRILVPAQWSPTSDELTRAGVRGDFYAHELVKLAPGAALPFLEEVRRRAIPIHTDLGIQLVGAFHTAMSDRSECLLLWAIPDHEHWAELELAEYADGELAGWRTWCQQETLAWQRLLLVEAPTSTLRLGRQPRVSDRRPLSEIP